MAFFFVTELIPLAVTAMAGAVVLGLMGIIKPNQVFTGLSNSTVVLFAAMFVIGSAMFHTGLAQLIGTTVVKFSGTKEVPLMFGVTVITVLMSSVSSNTGTVAALMPVIIAICSSAGISTARQLMPLAFAASAGGTITLVGTPPNIIGSGALTAKGLAGFGFFEFAKIGIPVSIVAIVYLLFIGRFLLPKQGVSEEEAQKAAAEHKGEAAAKSSDPRKMWITGLTLIGVIVVMACEIPIKKAGIGISLEMAATIGAIILVLTGCLTEKEAYRGIDWVTIFLFAGMMPVATAMDKSGAGKLIADWVVGLMGSSPSPYVLTAVLFALSAGLTQFMSNTASAALLCPLGIAIAQAINANPQPVVLAIAIAASCAFATPVGTPPNTLVLGAGGYKFMDYVKCGTPLVLLELVVCVIVIPIFWPFFN
jgi:anion transporter